MANTFLTPEQFVAQFMVELEKSCADVGCKSEDVIKAYVDGFNRRIDGEKTKENESNGLHQQ
jgi:hypothetical protein